MNIDIRLRNTSGKIIATVSVDARVSGMPFHQPEGWRWFASSDEIDEDGLVIFNEEPSLD